MLATYLRKTLFTAVSIFVLLSVIALAPHQTYAATAATWTAHPASNDTLGWRGVAWSPENNEFVAVGAGGIVTSPDGINWTPVTSPSANGWEAITWSPELYRYVAVSTDGTNRTMV